MAYDNSTRAAAAARTRAAVLAAAHERFLAQGYAGTTIREVAAAAGVSQETVYKRFGGKAGLLKAVYDVAMVGDDEPVPVSARPEAIAVRDAPDPTAAATAYGRLAAAVTGRAGGLMRLVLHARGTDADLEAFVATVDAERLAGATGITAAWADRGWLREGLDADRARDTMWTINAPAVWLLLRERGWDQERYAGWVRDGLLGLVLDPDA